LKNKKSFEKEARQRERAAKSGIHTRTHEGRQESKQKKNRERVPRRKKRGQNKLVVEGAVGARQERQRKALSVLPPPATTAPSRQPQHHQSIITAARLRSRTHSRSQPQN
jgi:hypothetical protein